MGTIGDNHYEWESSGWYLLSSLNGRIDAQLLCLIHRLSRLKDG